MVEQGTTGTRALVGKARRRQGAKGGPGVDEVWRQLLGDIPLRSITASELSSLAEATHPVVVGTTRPSKGSGAVTS